MQSNPEEATGLNIRLNVGKAQNIQEVLKYWVDSALWDFSRHRVGHSSGSDETDIGYIKMSTGRMQNGQSIGR
jgi:hypothetical protein